MKSHKTFGWFVAAAVFIAVGSAGTARSQEKPDALVALVAEIRQLRLTVEESNRQQAQIQSLAVYLSAQQSRLIQVGARLESVRNQESELGRILGVEEARWADLIARLDQSVKR
jgi:hypothetical protein